MRFIRWCLGIACITVLGTTSQSDAFDIQLTQEQIKEATEYGTKYKGTEIFESPVVKSACFGEYLKGEGGLILSKYIETAVVSAMKAMDGKTLTPEDIKKIEESATFKVVVVLADEDVKVPEDVQIILVQGTNNILPQRTEFGMKRKDGRQGVKGFFQFDKINPRANTTIVAKTRRDEKKYKIDLSDVR